MRADLGPLEVGALARLRLAAEGADVVATAVADLGRLCHIGVEISSAGPVTLMPAFAQTMTQLGVDARSSTALYSHQYAYFSGISISSMPGVGEVWGTSSPDLVGTPTRDSQCRSTRV